MSNETIEELRQIALEGADAYRRCEAANFGGDAYQRLKSMAGPALLSIVLANGIPPAPRMTDRTRWLAIIGFAFLRTGADPKRMRRQLADIDRWLGKPTDSTELDALSDWIIWTANDFGNAEMLGQWRDR